MKKEQILKILKVVIVATAIILITEGIFNIPAVNKFFSDLIIHHNGVVVYIIIWIIMFLQVTILNIPAYIVLSASVSVGIKTLSIEYIFVVLSAYMCGCVLSYLLGWKFGKKAVKWCAGSDEDYDRWCSVLNDKGKVWYFLTVLFPMFPDDLLCLVAGAVKLNFGFYCLANFIGRGVGLVTTLLALKLVGIMGGDSSYMLIVWALALYGEIIAYYILKKRMKENDES